MCFDYGAIDIAVNRLVEKLSPDAIILFGSASNGTANDDSDIDLLVVLDTNLNKSDRFVLARGAIGRIGTPVDVLVYTPEEFRTESLKNDSIVREAIDSGRLVYCVSTRYDNYDPPIEEMYKAFEMSESIVKISESL